VRLATLSSFTVCALLGACGKSDPEKAATGSQAISSASAAASAPAPAGLIERDADHVGGVIARAQGSDGVYIADEDHGLVRWIADTSPLFPTKPPPPRAPAEAASASASPSASASAYAHAPLSASARAAATAFVPVAVPTYKPSADGLPPIQGDRAVEVTQEVLAMGGAPANLVAIRDGALVTVRDPGKLVRIRKSDDGKLSVAHEIALAADAWGLAVNEAGTRALVTSAWTSTVTLIAITDGGLRKCAEVSVGREPRGVLFASDHTAYVNHLVGNQITRLKLGDECDEKSIGEVKAIVVAPSPTRSPAGKVLPASLGYSLALSPDAKRLFVPRHALGARAFGSWFGAATVDVLGLPEETSVAPMHEANLPGQSSRKQKIGWQQPEAFSNEPTESWTAFVQPRDIRYRRRSGTIVVVSEGANRLVELDAEALDPSFAIAALYELSDSFRTQLTQWKQTGFVADGARRDAYVSPTDANASNDSSCAAPQGVALDQHEDTAIIFCRASTTIARIRLRKSIEANPPAKIEGLHWASLGDDPGGKGLNLGRRLFYGSALAEGMGCAGCHPEGRDDGHVWREVPDLNGPGHHFMGGPEIQGSDRAVTGVPRRTPMLVDRVLSVGPYGWRGESETLEKRIEAGTHLHAFNSSPTVPAFYINSVGVFVRKGLTKPPASTRALTDEEQKGKAVFADNKTSCTVCHDPGHYFSNQTATRLPALPTMAGFAEEPGALYKTPSLLHVGHHGSLFHDGSAATLDELVEKNGTRMGDTSGLTPEQRKALVAYLKTL
jgi:cytochrome c